VRRRHLSPGRRRQKARVCGENHLTLARLPSLLPFFKGVYGSQIGRDDFEPEDIDYYFEYTGSLAVREGRRGAREGRERNRTTARRDSLSPFLSYRSPFARSHTPPTIAKAEGNYDRLDKLKNRALRRKGEYGRRERGAPCPGN